MREIGLETYSPGRSLNSETFKDFEAGNFKGNWLSARFGLDMTSSRSVTQIGLLLEPILVKLSHHRHEFFLGKVIGERKDEREEIDLVIDLSRKLGVRPVIGMCAKLRTKHSGHFGSTSGEKGKFGLTTTQILLVVKKLEQSGMLDCMQLLYFHVGSQIPSTALLADSVGEASQIYCELVRLGACMRVIDISGGLGIDYDGSKSPDFDVSVGYGFQEYAAAVVQAVRFVCDRKSVKHPVICSEVASVRESVRENPVRSTSSYHGRRCERARRRDSEMRVANKRRAGVIEEGGDGAVLPCLRMRD
ncbi:hypothetical protein LguiB_033319 [Lonicera macranthoides]